MQPIHAAILISNDLMRVGLERLLQEAECVQSVQRLKTITDLQQRAVGQSPALLILDDDLPGHEPCQRIITQLKQTRPEMKVLVLTDRLSERYAQAILRAGARGLICKRDRIAALMTACLITVLNGDIYLSPQFAALPYQQSEYGPLNQTDLAVLRLIEAGYDTQEIALRLQIVPRSVYRIRRKLRELLSVRTNEQIVDAARRQGLLQQRR